ncbi:MAG: FdhF/YdeP family oxidoreductase [Armatimonadetes bacterium]|nr:FdhF/YdeP family oxidoreductase [Armatimonadota bacterium]
MSKVTTGGGFASIGYTIQKAFEAEGGPMEFWRRMKSRNACKTCAYGMGGQRGGMTNEAGHFPEFCKKSVQAMAADMQPPIARDFFSHYSVSQLASFTPRQLENLGRLAYPMIHRAGEDRYQPIEWDEAFRLIATAMQQTDPSRSFFYSSGRSSNEAAFLLQWLARVYGTNNVNNCSFYCHQASGVGLARSIGSGTATVTLDDVEQADFVLLIGANPASNHPRLITTLVGIRERGGKVVVVNPLRETGLDRFNVPSRVGSLLFGSQVNDLYIQPRIGGDIAFLKGVLKAVIAFSTINHDFIQRYTVGWNELVESLEGESLQTLSANAGVSVEVIQQVAQMYANSNNAVFMWAMGITHHQHGADNVTAIANLALARGMVGRRNAGLMPIRGHSNVQGIGSVGFAPDLKEGFLKAMEDLYGLPLPRGKGMDSISSLHAAGRDEIDFALLLGGNFYAAGPDLTYARRALSRIRHCVTISTKLNQGHVCVAPQREGGWAIVLPTVVRDEEMQPTTQESMFSFVRLSDGGMRRPMGELRSEVEIITTIGGQLLPDGPIDFRALRNHDAVREVMARVVPGYGNIAEIGRTKQEFHVKDRVRHHPEFHFPDGLARFVPVGTPSDDRKPGQLRLMTIRSEGQFNTVVYEEHDRYRNQTARDVILLHPQDMQRLGIAEGERVTVVSATGSMPNILATGFNIAEGCAAMYYPEANVLIPVSVDAASGTPAFKNVLVSLSQQKI